MVEPARSHCGSAKIQAMSGLGKRSGFMEMRRYGRIRLPPMHPGQLRVHRNKRRFTVIVAGRRWGKTNFGVQVCLATCLMGGTAWWVAPTYGVSNIGWRKLKRLVRQLQPYAVIREAERRIEWPNGGSITVKSAHNPDNLRGEGLDLVVLDEAAYCDPEVWHEVLRPALMDRKGKALFISTPKGRNWFYDLYQQAGDNSREWARFQAPSSENPHLDPHEFDAARNGGVTSKVFAQEYLAEFVDAEGALFKTQDFRYYTMARDEAGMLWIKLLPRGEDEKPRWVKYVDCRRYMAADLAISTKTSADWTVAMVVAIAPTGELLVLDVQRRRMEGPDIVPFLAKVYRQWDPVSIGIEKVAFQAAIIQQARRAPWSLPVRDLIADKDKLTRAMPVAAKMEAGQVYFDRNADWLRDLEMELMYFDGGNSGHDDQVDALAYADRMRQQTTGSMIRVM